MGKLVIPLAAGYWLAISHDRRRLREAAKAQIGMIRDTIRMDESDASVKAAHSNTLEDLKKIVFHTLQLLSKERQNDLIDAWTKYRSIRFESLAESNHHARFAAHQGAPLDTPIRVVVSRLQSIEDAIN